MGIDEIIRHGKTLRTIGAPATLRRDARATLRVMATAGELQIAMDQMYDELEQLVRLGASGVALVRVRDDIASVARAAQAASLLRSGEEWEATAELARAAEEGADHLLQARAEEVVLAGRRERHGALADLTSVLLTGPFARGSGNPWWLRPLEG